jgi:adenine/guanine phosphoribosyltransferase-like PRPP-binding protein
MSDTTNTLQAAIDAINAIDIKDVPSHIFLTGENIEQWKTSLTTLFEIGVRGILVVETDDVVLSSVTANAMFLGFAIARLQKKFTTEY